MVRGLQIPTNTVQKTSAFMGWNSPKYNNKIPINSVQSRLDNNNNKITLFRKLQRLWDGTLQSTITKYQLTVSKVDLTITITK